MSFRLHDVTVTVGLTESDVNTPCGFFAGPGTASQLVVIDCPTSPQGRFVQISKTTETLTLCEVDSYGAEYAVDGNRGADFYQDKCIHTDPGDTNPWWRVDQLTVYSIKSVRILNRGIDHGGDFSNRLRDVTVTVGLTESDGNTPCGVFADLVLRHNWLSSTVRRHHRGDS
uniref:Fucolectin n=1 Tax=Magallana gigas TaxID=29159 RepID=K1QB41_MAGGI